MKLWEGLGYYTRARNLQKAAQIICSKYNGIFPDSYQEIPVSYTHLSDVWHANYLFGYDYNGLYDLYYKAGLKPSQMRVASPFNDYSKDSLNLYRVIDPEIWVRLVEMCIRDRDYRFQKQK